MLALDQREYKLGPNNVVIADENGHRVDRRHHGRRAFRLRREHHRRADRIGALGPDEHRQVRPHARHHHRCALSLRARRRSGIHGARSRAHHANWSSNFAAARRPRQKSSAMPAISPKIVDFPMSEVKRLTGLEVSLGRERHDPEEASASGVEGSGERVNVSRAVLASGCRRQGRSRRRGHAHPRRRQHRCRRRLPSHGSRQRQDPDDAADPHAPCQARARARAACWRPSPGRSFREDAGEALRRRLAGTEACQPDRSRHVRHAPVAAAGSLDRLRSAMPTRASATWRSSKSPAPMRATGRTGQRRVAGGIRRGTASLTGAGRHLVERCQGRRQAGRCLRRQGRCDRGARKPAACRWAMSSSKPGGPAWYHPGRSGTIKLGPKIVLGYLRRIPPEDA